MALDKETKPNLLETAPYTSKVLLTTVRSLEETPRL